MQGGVSSLVAQNKIDRGFRVLLIKQAIRQFDRMADR